MKLSDSKILPPTIEEVSAPDGYLTCLYKILRPLVAGIVYKSYHLRQLRTDEPDLADLIAGDVIKKVKRCLPMLVGMVCFRGWLTRVVYNRCTDYKRLDKTDKGRRNGVEFDECAYQAYDRDIDYLVNVEAEEQRGWSAVEKRIRIIKKYYKGLPEEKQEMFRLRFIQQLKYPEIAQIMHLTISTATKRGERLQQDIKKLL